MQRPEHTTTLACNCSQLTTASMCKLPQLVTPSTCNSLDMRLARCATASIRNCPIFNLLRLQLPRHANCSRLTSTRRAFVAPRAGGLAPGPAGTETPAASSRITLCHFIVNPFVLSRLHDKHRTDLASATCTQLQQLPRLSVVLEEGSRLPFSMTAGSACIAHESLTYTLSPCVKTPSNICKSYTFPPGMPASTTTLSTQTAKTTSPKLFKSTQAASLAKLSMSAVGSRWHSVRTGVSARASSWPAPRRILATAASVSCIRLIGLI